MAGVIEDDPAFPEQKQTSDDHYQARYRTQKKKTLVHFNPPIQSKELGDLALLDWNRQVRVDARPDNYLIVNLDACRLLVEVRITRI